MNKIESGLILVCRGIYLKKFMIYKQKEKIYIIRKIPLIAVDQNKLEKVARKNGKLLKSEKGCPKNISVKEVSNLCLLLIKKWKNIKKIFIAIHDLHANKFYLPMGVYQSQAKNIPKKRNMQDYDDEVKKRCEKRIDIETWAFTHDDKSEICKELIEKLNEISPANFNNIIEKAFLRKQNIIADIKKR